MEARIGRLGGAREDFAMGDLTRHQARAHLVYAPDPNRGFRRFTYCLLALLMVAGPVALVAVTGMWPK